MAAQTVKFILVEGETNSVCKAYSLIDGTLVGTSATLAAADTSGVEYAYVFTDLPAAEYKFVAVSSGGYALDAKFGTVALATGTYPIYYERSAERYALSDEITAMRGADDDTLKTLSDAIDLISSGGGSLTQGDIDSIVAAITAVADNIQQAQAGILTAYEYTTWSQDIEDLVALTSNTDIIFVLKRRMQDADAQALLKVSRTTGLMILNGVDVSSSRSDEASITVNQASPTGEITLLVESTAMAEVPRGKWIDGLKMLHASGDAILRQGTTIIRESAVDETS